MLEWLSTATRSQLIGAGLVAMLVVGLLFVGIQRSKKSVDFNYHRTFGQRFVEKHPPLYDDNLCFNYMPAAAMYYAPLALVPPKLAFAARYLAALACLWLVLKLLWSLLPQDTRPRRRLLLVILTLAGSFRYILRDLDDGGPHLLLLGMLVGGMACARRGWNVLGGFWFGLTIAIKMTPALLLAYLVWKRRWRLLLATVTAAALWIVAPALWLGTDLWWHYQQQWQQVAFANVTGKDLGPITEFMNYNDQRIQNQSLKMALTHLLVTYPEGDFRRPESGYWSVLNLDPAVARWIVNLGLAGLLLVFWRRMRSTALDDRAAMPLEFSALLLLMLLLSPVTWLQHLVWAIPALFILLARELSVGGSWLSRALLACTFVLTMALNREFLGAEMNSILLASHVHTVGMLLLLGMILRAIAMRKVSTATIAAPLPIRRAA